MMPYLVAGTCSSGLLLHASVTAHHAQPGDRCHCFGSSFFSSWPSASPAQEHC